MSFIDNAGVSDGKVARQAILQKANVILTGLLNNLASNYVTSSAFTLFAGQLKALAFEAARIISISEDVYNDTIFKTTRPDFISQNIESFLFYNQRFSHFEQTDVQVRSFILALIQAYFKGATASSIQSALTFEFSQEGQISFALTEPIYQEYTNPSIDFVPLQHQFTVAINADNSAIDIITLQSDVEFLVNLIKPAHTQLETQFIFLEPQDNTDNLGRINCIIVTDGHGNPLIDEYGFEVTQKLGTRSICDAFRLAFFEYQYEDVRFDCLSTTQMSESAESAILLSSTTLKTRYGPVSDGDSTGKEQFAFSSVTSNSNPGSGGLRFNNATFSLVSQIYVSNTDSLNDDATGWLASLDGSLTVSKLSDETIFIQFTVTSVTSHTGYYALNVVYVSKVGTVADGDVLSLDAGSGRLISNVNQVTVNVNSSPVTVLSVNALTGLITLASPVSNSDVVTVSYSWLRRYFDTFTLNNRYTLLNQFDNYNDTLPAFKYSTLIWSPNPALPNKNPITCAYTYSGFDAEDTSLLNDPTTLVFNRISSRDKLNDSSTWATTTPVVLNEGESLFVYRQEKTLLVENDTFTYFKLNDPNSILNSSICSVLGDLTRNQVVGDVVDKVYASINVMETCTGGESGRLKPMCEDGLGLTFGAPDGSTGPFSDLYRGVQNEGYGLFVTNDLGSWTNRDVLFRRYNDVTQYWMAFSDLKTDAYHPVTESLVSIAISISGFVDTLPVSDNEMILNPMFLTTFGPMSDSLVDVVLTPTTGF